MKQHYVEKRFISEGGRMVSEVLETTDVFKIQGFLLTTNIEKNIDSVSHLFIIIWVKNCIY